MKYILALGFLLFSYNTLALDTSEEYPQGHANFEAYSIHEKSGSTFFALSGYGHSRWLNPSISIQQTPPASEEDASMDYCLGNFSHVYAGQFDVDFMIHATTAGQETTTRLTTEVTHPFVLLTPYIRAATEILNGEHTESATLGLSWFAQSSLEALIEYSEEFADERTAYAAVGLNYKSTESMEIVSEVGHQYSNGDTLTSLGIIWTQ